MNKKVKLTNMFLTGSVLVSPYSAFAQTNANLVNVLWSSEFSESGDEYFSSISKTKDGGFILSGEADLLGDESISRGDAVIVKYGKSGEREWYNSISGDETDLFYDTIESSDGSFYSIGRSYSSDVEFENPNNLSHSIIVKFDEEGSREWIKAEPNDATKMEYEKIIELDSEKIAVVGRKMDGINLKKFITIIDSNGEVVSTSDISSAEIVNTNAEGDVLYDMVKTKDGGFVFVGAISEDGKNIPLIIKFSSQGVEQWRCSTKDDPQLKGSQGHFSKVVEDTNGNVIAVGSVGDDSSITHDLIVSLDSSGKKILHNKNKIVDGYNAVTLVTINSKNEIVTLSENIVTKNKDKLTKLDIMLTKYSADGSKVTNKYNMNPTVKNAQILDATMLDNDKMILVGTNYKAVEGEIAKCNVQSEEYPSECIQKDGLIIKVSLPEVTDSTEDVCKVNEKPVIKAEDKTIYIGDKFDKLEGVTATDKEDGDLTSSIKVPEGNIDTSVAGVYKLTYSVEDKCGNKTEQIRTITVKAKELNSSDSSSTDKPQTGDISVVYAGLALVSSIGLIKSNKKKR